MCPDTGYRQITGQSPHGRFRLLLTEPAGCEILRLPVGYSGYDPGVPVEIESSDGKTTVATFASYGDGETTAWAGPGGAHFTVISGGDAFLVPYADASKAVRLPGAPVRFSRLVHEDKLLILAGWTTVYGIDAEGPLWRSVLLGDDDLEIEQISERQVSGTAWDAANQIKVKFELETRSGRLISGGVRPEDSTGRDRYWHREMDA